MDRMDDMDGVDKESPLPTLGGSGSDVRAVRPTLIYRHAPDIA